LIQQHEVDNSPNEEEFVQPEVSSNPQSSLRVPTNDTVQGDFSN
jgi:hypothetical protein